MARSGAVTTLVVMPTSIRLPPKLLARVDARAKALGVSRNDYLVGAIEAGIDARDTWSPELLSILEKPLDASTRHLFDDSMTAVRKARRNRRRAPRL